MSTTATQRSLALLKKWGFRTAVVEKWNPHVKIRQDLYGFIDMIGVSCASGIFMVQSTTSRQLSDHARKIVDDPKKLEVLHGILYANVRFEVWAWVQRGRRWFPRRLHAIAQTNHHGDRCVDWSISEDAESRIGSGWLLWNLADRARPDDGLRNHETEAG